MTIGHVLEMIAGKVGSMEGRIIDGTAFSGEREASIRDGLERNGFKNTGKEIMYDGRTGRMIQAEVYTPHFNRIPWDIEAVNDKVTGERTPLREIPHMGNKFTYFCYRNSLTFLLKPTFCLLNFVRNIKNKLSK